MLAFEEGKGGFMKTQALLSLMLMAGLTVSAASHSASALELSLHNGAPIKVAVDGMRYGKPAPVQSIFHLPPGMHHLKVWTVMAPYGRWGSQWILVYQGPISLYSGFITRAVIDCHNQLVVQAYSPLYPPALPGSLPCSHSPQHFSCTAGCEAIAPGAWSGYPFPQRNYPMGAADFSNLLRSIEMKTFESTRVNIAREAIDHYYFTSEQVKQLASLFTFESSRLEIAQYAYPKVVDPERYYIVYDVFTFESSIHRLQSALAAAR
ncbi:MAG: hypothetical protein KatS3mg031_0265 [Chitinophagales bacterium]|nr:MAG: hypothetical protein KatS3mg031_0265 [Chitinophagales bacterium]